ncbi:MAG: YkvA family protein [Pseudomonadota bacterium]
MSDKPPARFDTFRRRAQGLLGSPGRLRALLTQGVDKLAGSGSSQFGELRQQLSLAIALVRAWLDGDYREVSEKTLIVLVAALLYFVVPIDVIPDFLLGWGYLDDIAVVGYVFNQVAEEIAAFEQWRKAREVDVNKAAERPPDSPEDQV